MKMPSKCAKIRGFELFYRYEFTDWIRINEVPLTKKLPMDVIVAMVIILSFST